MTGWAQCRWSEMGNSPVTTRASAVVLPTARVQQGESDSPLETSGCTGRLQVSCADVRGLKRRTGSSSVRGN